MKTEHHLESEGGCSSSSRASSWVSVCPSGLVEVTRKKTLQAGAGEVSPRLGSLCRVRVCPKAVDISEAQDCPCMGEHGTLNEAHDDAQELLYPCSDAQELLYPCSDAQELLYPRCVGSVLQIPEGAWVLIRMGDGQCDVIESCLEGMRAGEKCELLVAGLNDGVKPESTFTQQRESSITDPSELKKQKSESQQRGQISSDPLCFVLELHSFTPGKESWEMQPGVKWTWVKGHKKQGGERFRQGDVWGAAHCYSRALRLLVTFKGEQKGQMEMDTDTETEGNKDEDECIKDEVGVGDKSGQGATGGEKDNGMRVKKVELGVSLNTVTSSNKAVSDNITELSPDEECVPSEDEYKATKSELHSNLSLCQLKLGQPAKARLSSSMATELDPCNAKAWYRLGQACSQVGELACARVAFKKVLELQPGSPSAQKALREVNMREKELDSKLGQRLSKMFT